MFSSGLLNFSYYNIQSEVFQGNFVSLIYKSLSNEKKKKKNKKQKKPGIKISKYFTKYFMVKDFLCALKNMN